jgi:hypothetical protein
LNIRWLLVLAMVLRFVSIFLLRSYLHPNTWEFAEYARNIAAGRGYVYGGSPSAYMPPAYPVLLAGVFMLFGENPAEYLFLALVQAALGVLLVYLVYRLTLTLYADQAKARLAGLFACLYPPFVQMCNEFHSINFYIVLGVAAVLFLVRAIQQPARWDYLTYSALCSGILQFFRGEAFALVFLFGMLLFFLRRSGSLAQPWLFLAIAYACIAPWTLRNYLVFHAFVPTTTATGINLWIGNNPKATGSDRAEDDNVPPTMKAELEAVPMGGDKERRLNGIYVRESLAYIGSHLQHESILALRKLLIFWTFDPNHQKASQPAYWVPSVALSILAAVGLFVGITPPLRETSPLLVSIGFTVLMGLVFFVLPRYKIAIDPFLCVLAANAGTYLVALATRAESP